MDTLTFNELPNAVALLYEKVSDIERLLVGQSKPQAETDIFMSITEAAKFVNLSVPTLYGLCHRSQIPYSKQGKKLYFSKFELTDWIKSGRRKTVTETAQEAEDYLAKKRKETHSR